VPPTIKIRDKYQMRTGRAGVTTHPRAARQSVEAYRERGMA
jgi:hypothetical protein